jgi:hypothetical protein
MDQGIHECFPEGPAVEIRDGSPEQARFHFLLLVAHLEPLFDMFEPAQEWASLDPVDPDIGAFHDLGYGRP